MTKWSAMTEREKQVRTIAEANSFPEDRSQTWEWQDWLNAITGAIGTLAAESRQCPECHNTRCVESGDGVVLCPNCEGRCDIGAVESYKVERDRRLQIEEELDALREKAA